MMCVSDKDRKKLLMFFVIDLRRLKRGAGEGLRCVTVLINMTRTPPQIPISLPNINSLIIAAVLDGF